MSAVCPYLFRDLYFPHAEGHSSPSLWPIIGPAYHGPRKRGSAPHWRPPEATSSGPAECRPEFLIVPLPL